jgi:hypothetical protein
MSVFYLFVQQAVLKMKYGIFGRSDASLFVIKPTGTTD